MTAYSSRLQGVGTTSKPRSPLPNDAPGLLVGYGFRGWIGGYQTGDVRHWERVWRLYSNVMKPCAARNVVGCLSSWVKSVNNASIREVEINSTDDGCNFCRDECLAISMIAASQHNTCPAMRACAFALVDTAMMEDVLHHAETFAVTLRSQQQVVSPRWIVNANSFIDSNPDLVH